MWACGILFIRMLTLKLLFLDIDRSYKAANKEIDEYQTRYVRKIFNLLGTPTTEYAFNEYYRLKGFPIYKENIGEVF